MPPTTWKTAGIARGSRTALAQANARRPCGELLGTTFSANLNHSSRLRDGACRISGEGETSCEVRIFDGFHTSNATATRADHGELVSARTFLTQCLTYATTARLAARSRSFPQNARSLWFAAALWHHVPVSGDDELTPLPQQQTRALAECGHVFRAAGIGSRRRVRRDVTVGGLHRLNNARHPAMAFSTTFFNFHNQKRRIR